MYTIKRAAELVGVSTSTLRAWERRYGIGTAERTQSGYRLYDEYAVRALRMMHTLVGEGWSVRAAAEETNRRTAVESRPLLPSPGDEPPDTGALVRAAETLDHAALGSLLDRRFGGATFETVADDWLLPALREVGSAWESGQISVAGEHLIAAGVARRLASAYDAAGDHPAGPRVLIGLPPGARHDLGILAFATAARRAGLSTGYLGADVPAQDWATAAAAWPAACAVLAVPMEPDAEPLPETVAAIEGARPGILVAVGGAAQDLAPPSCLRLGHLVGPAARTLSRRLTRAGRPPPKGQGPAQPS
ncbi:MerR family transcriptional regulator [Nocardioides insulae]|uniref:MerR family transcriptional regulator n=1 Tax=Nocardioides insulae TaxID=394734 RepID=UPI0004265809|nr:MerR family transcriptional regulator [Nocardioides insulae]